MPQRCQFREAAPEGPRFSETAFFPSSMEIGTNQWGHNFQQQSSKMTTTKYQMGTAGTAKDQRLLQTLLWWTEQICWTVPAPHSKKMAGQPVSSRDNTSCNRRDPETANHSQRRTGKASCLEQTSPSPRETSVMEHFPSD